MSKQSLNNPVKGKFIFNFIFLFVIHAMFFLQVYGQTFSISGKITSSRYSVRNASVTFIDRADTTRKFSALTDDSGIYQINIVTSIESNVNTHPTKFQLGQNYPNPFSSSTAIPYEINKESNIQVTIYDILGRVVRKYDIGRQAVGRHSILWDGGIDLGSRVANGIYFYRLDADGESQVRKMIFNKGSKVLLSLPRTLASNESLLKTNTIRNNQGNTYTVRIENTGVTSPFIVSEEITGIIIENDTTINFSVDYLPVATIDFDSLHQIISGFGAASPWYRPVMTISEVETAFGTGDGQLGFSILRLTIEPDSTIWGKYLTSVKKARDLGAIIIAAPWYAPSNIVETTAGGVSRVRYDKYNEYAAHLNSYNSFMQNNGVSIYGISIQNEPDIEDQWTSWTSDEIFTFMRDYAHEIVGTKVMAPESFHFDHSYSDPILNDSLACANTDIICGHIYGGGLTSYPLAKSKGKEVWMTEHLIGENNSGFNLSWAIQLAKEMNDVMNADMSAYVWWTIVRYYGPLGDGEKATNPQDPNEIYPNKGEVTKKGYVMSQFSKFIRPGFYRVESSVYPALGAASTTAYKDPSSSKIIIVAVNTGSTQLKQVFKIQDGAMTTILTPYTTSESKNCEEGSEVNVTDGSFTYTLESSSITTFVSNY